MLLLDKMPYSLSTRGGDSDAREGPPSRQDECSIKTVLYRRPNIVPSQLLHFFGRLGCDDGLRSDDALDDQRPKSDSDDGQHELGIAVYFHGGLSLQGGSKLPPVLLARSDLSRETPDGHP